MEKITVITRTTPKKDRGFMLPNRGVSQGHIADQGLTSIMSNFDTLAETGLLEFDVEEWEVLADHGDNADVLNMLLIDPSYTDEYLMHVTFEELIRFPYFRAQAAIKKFPMVKRIEMLQRLDDVRSYVYDRLGQDETGLPREEQLTSKQRQSLFGRLKHLEILLGWLYGIDTVDIDNEKKWVTNRR